jgi:hypothetical protein
LAKPTSSRYTTLIMRHWLFHPVIFYPLAALFAAFVIALSVQPQAWPRQPAPVAGVTTQGALLLEGAAFNSPDPGVGQHMRVARDFWGRPQALRIAQIPNQPAPLAAEHGVRVLLIPASAAALQGRPIAVEVSYNPLPINAASSLAVSLRGDAPAEWVSLQTPPQAGTLRFEFPTHASATAIGLRALSSGTDQAYGIEITSIKISPRSAAPPAPPAPAN